MDWLTTLLLIVAIVLVALALFSGFCILMHKILSGTILPEQDDIDNDLM